VHGTSSSGTGVAGSTISGWGSYGHSTTGDGVHGDTAGTSSSGVAGINTGAGGYGVFGGGGIAGVFGTSGNGGTTDGTTGIGVLGIGANGTGGAFGATGVRGVEGGTPGGYYGVLGISTASNNYGVIAWGALGATGAKTFLEPHPTDASKEIRYASLEGREVGTYFRGTGHLVGGRATIDIPDDFRMVTASDGLTVQLTAIEIGGPADVEFDYQVNGVRKAYADFEPVVQNVDFVPETASDPLFTRPLPAESIRRLKSNGTLNADGSINAATAHRLGWDRRPGWSGPSSYERATATAAAALDH
jgi:hypothetical protein